MVGIFGKRSLTAVEKLEVEIRDNEYWPFVLLEDGLFAFQRRFERFYYALIVFILSVGLLITLIAVGISTANLVIWPLVTCVAAAFIMLSYGAARTYTVDTLNNAYSFAIGNTLVVEGPLRNIYVRLRKRKDSGRNYYFLVLNGYRLDPQILSEISRDQVSLRRIGQQIAKNVGINYFDEPNVSPHHRVIHQKDAVLQ